MAHNETNDMVATLRSLSNSMTFPGSSSCTYGHHSITDIQCESKKSSPPKTFCDIFIYGKPVQLKIIVAITQTYFYVYTNFGPFI